MRQKEVLSDGERALGGLDVLACGGGKHTMGRAWNAWESFWKGKHGSL